VKTSSSLFFSSRPVVESPVVNIYTTRITTQKFWRPRCLRCGSAAARLLGLWVRIPPESWSLSLVNIGCLAVRGLCDGPIPRPGEYYRLSVYVSQSVIRCARHPLHLQWVGRKGQTKKICAFLGFLWIS
jgi:hypothetical protein